MDEDKKNDQFDAALPLPGVDQPHSSDQPAPEPDESPKPDNPAADLIRQKIEAAYLSEPSLGAEADEVELISPTTKLSKHQQFVNALMNSGKSLVEIQTAWHEYYQSLSDTEKHEVWQEFYIMHAQTSQFVAAANTAQPPDEPRPHVVATPKASTPVSRTLGELHLHVLKNVARTKGYKPPKHVQSLLFGLAAGTGALMIVLFSFFNERIIAPFIQPSRNVTNTPLIADASAVGAAPEVIIPKINVEIPVVYGVSTIDESAIDAGLENGVVHYADTANPGQNGNLVIVGHSSNNIFNKGRYKFAFVLLNRLEIGDTFYLQKDGKRYTYQVYKREIVDPANVSVLGSRDKPATATLITCDPPGTSINRLVVVGEQISPNPASNTAQTAGGIPQPRIIPGNSQTLWYRLTHWLSN